MTALFVGVDGGATRSRAVVTDADGTVLARREGGAAIVRPENPAAAAATVSMLVRVALDDVTRDASAAVLCCALAGAGRDAEADAVRTLLQHGRLAARVMVVTDAHAALHDAFGTGPGILLIAGTGSVAWGRGDGGRMVRAGGWGHLLGDEGSSYALGLAALRSLVRAHDGREPASAMHAPLLERTGCAAPADLVAWAVGAAKADIAALAVTVTTSAAAGDARARAILDRSTDALLAHVRAVHDRLAPWPAREPVPVALAGGLADAAGPLHAPLGAALHGDARGFALRAGAVDAARGAAAMARGQRSVHAVDRPAGAAYAPATRRPEPDGVQ